MAIKVSGTTVIDDSRQLSNIASVDATTVAALGAAGVGGGAGSLEATADGTIADGKTCIIQADGTVKQVGTTTQTNDPPTQQGSNIDVINSTTTSQNAAIVYVPNTNYVVYFFKDNSDANKGKFTVGTIDSANNTISWSGTTLFEANSAWEIDAVYDASLGGFYVVWCDVDNTRRGTIMFCKINYSTAAIIKYPAGYFWSSYAEHPRVATDGNGRGVIFNRSQTNNQGYVVSFKYTDSTNTFNFSDYNINAGTTLENDIAYDANADRYVAVWRDNSNNEYGTARCIQMDASPNYGLGFGSEFQFDSNTSDFNRIEYNASAQKLMIAWRRESSSFVYSLRMCAVTINTGSNDLSFGTHAAVTFSTGVPQYIAMAYDSNQEGIGVVYRDGANSNYGAFYFTTISGTTVSLSSKGSFSTNTNVYPTSMAYSIEDQRYIPAFTDANGYAKTALIARAETITNLTDENFVGLSDGAYTNGQTATIQLVGSVDDAQTGLTAGQKYYVQNDGTLALTASSPSVYAGIAVASDKIIVKG